MDRLQFLGVLNRKSYPTDLADKLLRGYRKSSIRQAEVGWRAFKEWLPPSIQSISKSEVLQFLVHLERTGYSANTILAYRNSLKTPLEKAFGFSFKDEDFSVLARAQFLDNPPAVKIIPQWSLEEALDVIAEKPSLIDLEFKQIFMITLFLVAIATGARASELASIDRKTISFSPSSRSVCLPTVPGFLYKNQNMNRVPPPISIPALEGSPLCPVRALQLYIRKTSNIDSSRLFLNPDSGSALNSGTLSYWLCKSINYLLPNAICRAHDTRKLAHSLAWARGVPISDIIKKGFWSSVNVFIKRSLVNNPTTNNRRSCVVIGSRV